MQRQLLILGGSSEALALARALQGDPRFKPVLSLAGRTQAPMQAPIPVRRGGFGGAEGLARYLGENGIGLVIDATHPFADRMKRHAVEAAQAANIPLLAVRRPEWQQQPGDRWTQVDKLADAALALGEASRRVFLTTGRTELAPFAAAPQHVYLLRSVEPPEPESLPPRVTLIVARGPFALEDELALMRRHAIEIVVAKNSGGTGAAAKLEAARRLRLRVVMVRRPALPDCASVETVEAALHWLNGPLDLRPDPHGPTNSAPRGV
jgi:precorrin-6A/cobalt-precorrin-6A reductase